MSGILKMAHKRVIQHNLTTWEQITVKHLMEKIVRGLLVRMSANSYKIVLEEAWVGYGEYPAAQNRIQQLQLS